jgi:hypothetical protein
MANSKLLVLVNSSNSRYYYALRGLKALAHECIEQVVFLRRKKKIVRHDSSVMPESDARKFL